MGRMGKIVYILVLAVAAAVIAFPFLTILSYYILPVSPSYVSQREGLIDLTARRGYKICGEVTLGYGESVRAVFSKIFSEEVACLVFFNLPEPKNDYVIYQPAARFMITPVKQEDMDKPYRYSFKFGAPGLVIHERLPLPFINENRGVYIGSAAYYELFKNGVRGRDLFALFSYKPVNEPEMPVNITIIVDVIVLKHGERYEPIVPPKPPRTGGEWITIMEELDESLEGLGYSNCGEYHLEPGAHPLNLTFIFDPYEGKACYVKILPKDLDRYRVRILGGNHTQSTMPPPPDIEIERAWMEETPISFHNPYSLLLKANPAYEHYEHNRLPRAFSKERYELLGPEGSGAFGEVVEDIVYIVFSLRITPDSQIEPRDFRLVYKINMDVEIRPKPSRLGGRG